MTLTFGNQGGLFMNAMTWWDHETRSIWSQPWGRALKGDLKGTELIALPAEVTTWGAFRADHPDALVLTATDGLGRGYDDEAPTDDFVIGVAIEGNALAVRYADAAKAGLINESVGGEPIVVFVDPDTRTVRVFSRRIDSDVLGFAIDENGSVTDAAGSGEWDLAIGVAVQGRNEGARLKPVPHVTAFDWAWQDFWPDSRLIGR